MCLFSRYMLVCTDLMCHCQHMMAKITLLFLFTRLSVFIVRYTFYLPKQYSWPKHNVIGRLIANPNVHLPSLEIRLYQ